MITENISPTSPAIYVCVCSWVVLQLFFAIPKSSHMRLLKFRVLIYLLAARLYRDLLSHWVTPAQVLSRSTYCSLTFSSNYRAH